MLRENINPVNSKLQKKINTSQTDKKICANLLLLKRGKELFENASTQRSRSYNSLSGLRQSTPSKPRVLPQSLCSSGCPSRAGTWSGPAWSAWRVPSRETGCPSCWGWGGWGWTSATPGSLASPQPQDSILADQRNQTLFIVDKIAKTDKIKIAQGFFYLSVVLVRGEHKHTLIINRQLHYIKKYFNMVRFI